MNSHRCKEQVFLKFSKIGSDDNLDIEYIEQNLNSFQNDIIQSVDYMMQKLNSEEDSSVDTHILTILQAYFEMASSLIQNAKETSRTNEELTDQLHDVTKRFDVQAKHNDERDEEMRKLQERIESLEREIEDQEAFIETIREENQEYKNELQESRKDLQKLKQENKLSKSQSFSESSKLNQSENEEALKETYEAKIAELESTIKIHEQQGQKLLQRLIQTESENEDLARLVSKLESELEQSNEQRDIDMTRAHQELVTRDRTIIQLKNMVAEKEDAIKGYILRENSFKAEKLVSQEEHFLSPEKKGSILSPVQMMNEHQSSQDLEKTMDATQENKAVSMATELQDLNCDTPQDDSFNESSNSQYDRKRDIIYTNTRSQPRQKLLFNDISTMSSLKSDRQCQTDFKDEVVEVQKMETHSVQAEPESHKVDEGYLSSSYVQSMIHENTSAPSKDFEEEYFKMTVFAVKLKHEEEDPEFQLDIDPRKLFKHAKRLKIPFQDWHQWIDKQIIQMEKKYKPDLMEKVGGFMTTLKVFFYGQRD